jgi:antitoxin component YwqK of YwqJK toxin-antitoxin module
MRIPDEELDYDEDIIYVHNGKRFTGIAFEESAHGILSECTYLDGMQDGPSRDWYPDGTLKAEMFFKENLKNGTSREIFPDGKLASEIVFGYDIALKCMKYDQRGEVVECSSLEEGSSLHSLYLTRRERFADS